MAQSLISIGGVVKDSSTVTFPTSGRDFREAWQFNGNVIEVDTAMFATQQEDKVQSIANDLTDTDERMMALALATVDLKMVDTTGMTKAQVRQQFKDRVVFYLRERRGI